MRTQIFALHGFLGQTKDWQLVQERVHEEKPDWEFHTISLFDSETFSAKMSFELWAKKFNEFVLSKGRGRRTLLGYSLGGRLGLHALEQNPEIWNGAVFLSTHPGLRDENEKSQRKIQDQKWADRFLNENFSEVLREWNDQSVFKGSSEPERFEAHYRKELLSLALKEWSLGKQKDFRSILLDWPFRQIWAAGEKDQKFSELLKTLPKNENLQGWIVEGTSHRLLFEAPEEIAHFVIRVSSKLEPVELS